MWQTSDKSGDMFNSPSDCQFCIFLFIFQVKKKKKTEAQWDLSQAHPLTTLCTPVRRPVHNLEQRPMWEFENVDFIIHLTTRLPHALKGFETYVAWKAAQFYIITIW